ncbi:hypothetical protein SAY86_014082 [Trapa natans]|uniref:Uncharacterized protein n=1 Tax=Trapa natans TaxID=22666 RepID=A0AAN7QMI1_TRANT|nr:hypothetical protein SAY86_014082 [Trapa natans]
MGVCSVSRACCLLLLLLLFLTVRPLSALPSELSLAAIPATTLAHAPGHQPHGPNPHHHHHHLLAPGPSPLYAPAHAPAEHHHHHNVHAPAPAPGPYVAHGPTKAPVHTPSHAPVHTPSQAPAVPRMSRSFIAVQGVVYCKSCKYPGVDTLLGATPLLEAEVKLQCNSSRRPVVVSAKTDKNGYFFVKAPKTVTTYAFHKCKVSLVSSPSSSACKKPSDLHGGLCGATLRPEKHFVANKLPFVLFSVGPLAFEPQCPR